MKVKYLNKFLHNLMLSFICRNIVQTGYFQYINVFNQLTLVYLGHKIKFNSHNRFKRNPSPFKTRVIKTIRRAIAMRQRRYDSHSRRKPPGHNVVSTSQTCVRASVVGCRGLVLVTVCVVAWGKMGAGHSAECDGRAYASDPPAQGRKKSYSRRRR